MALRDIMNGNILEYVIAPLPYAASHSKLFVSNNQ